MKAIIKADSEYLKAIFDKYSEETAEKKTSILDVDLDGVPDSNESTFNYGYEKEDTVVMKPVEEGKDTESTEEEKK